MHLTNEEQDMLEGKQGAAVRKAMEILAALGKIYAAERLVPVSSVQISGVSYDNLGDAGLEWLSEMADGGGKTRVLTTLNPAGMDIDNPQSLGIPADFAAKQALVIQAFARMDVITTCSCTPYLFGNLPHFGEHIAWAESSAVCYANSALGARTNREGGPSALAASLTGRTPAYGMHLDENRKPSLAVQVTARLEGTRDFGALGYVLGKITEARRLRAVLYVRGIPQASVEELKSFCASAATYGGAALVHIEGITPEAAQMAVPQEMVTVGQEALDEAVKVFNQPLSGEIDFVSLGCPHLSLREIIRIADLLRGKRVKKTFWITTSRPVKQIADRMGYSKVIEESGAVFATDTCCVVAPIKSRFNAMVTDSAKACYYAAAKNKFQTVFLPFDEVVQEALR